MVCERCGGGGGGVGGSVIPYIVLYVEVAPERGTSFRLGVSLVS